MLRSLLVIALVLCAANIVAAAEPFKDVPANHWAYQSIQKAVEAKVIQGYEGLFHGKRNVTRYQLAEVVGKMLDKCGGAPAAGGDAGQVKQLENLVTEFADELALLNVKVGKLEETCNKGGKAPVAENTGNASVYTERGNLHIGGIIKARYESRDQDDTVSDDDGNGYWNPETRLYLDHALTDDIKARVSWEMASGLEGYTGVAAYTGAGMGAGLLDAKLTFKMHNSESYIDFGQFQPEIGYLGGKLTNQLEFVDYPLYLNILGPGTAPVAPGDTGFGNGIWWQDGFQFNFQNKNKTGKFAIGRFNGGMTPTSLDTDDEKATYIGGKFYPKSGKISGGLWYWAEDFGVDNDFTAMGLWFRYAKPEKWNALIEYVTPEWNYGLTAIDDVTDLLFAFRMPFKKDKNEFGLRYEKLDTSEDTTWTRMTLGLVWKMDKNCHMALEYMGDSIDTSATTDISPSHIVLQAMYFF